MSKSSIDKEKLCAEFRKCVENVVHPLHDDAELEKWLRARLYKLEDAEKMYKASMGWRRVMKADTILDTFEPPAVLKQYYPGGFCGHDSEFRPVFIDPLGKMDMKGIVNSASREDIMKLIMCRFEALHRHFREVSKEQGRPINQVLHILDLDGFGRKQLYIPGAEMIIAILKMNDANYPETLYRTYIINAPQTFHLGYSVIKPFLSEETKQKFIFLGSSWKTELRKAIGTDTYPAHWGGNMTDPDEYCSSKICMGGAVPQEYYQPDLVKKDLADIKTVTIPKGETFSMEFQVNVRSIIKWYFYTESKDIEFGITYKDTSNKDGTVVNPEEQVIEPMKTVNCNRFPENGSYICDKPGTYKLIFDNKKSWISSKTLKYNIEVLTDDTQIQQLEDGTRL